MPSVGVVTSNLNIITKTTDYLAVANNFVLMDATGGPLTVTLPTAPATNMLVAVKKSDSSTNAVTVVPGAGANINGDTACILAIQGASATFQYDGTNWQLLSTGAINMANPAAGLPSGGTSGQVLAKNSATNYDATWSTPSSGLPTGGSSGQVLTKNSPTNYDVGWASAPAASGGHYFPWTAGRVFTGAPVVATPTTGTPGTSLYSAWFPIRVPNACTISQVALINMSGSVVTLYLALYSDVPTATSGGPGLRLVGGQATSPGTVNAASPVSLSYTFTGPTTVWVAMGTSSGNISCLTHAGTLPAWNFAMGGINTYSAGSGAFRGSLYSTNFSSSATAADVSSLSFTVSNSPIPIFLFTVV